MSDSYHCPNCGAPASADAARCEYCCAPLATVNCPKCFAPMFVGSRFCPRCGAAAAREAIDDAAPLSCPRCATAMQALRLATTAVHECAACGGLWVDPESLQKLCDAGEQHAGVTAALAARTPSSVVAPDTVRYIPCPRCKKLMNRVNFAHTSGVILDVCRQDGVWLDRGELQRVMGFVEHGGLAASREHEREQLEEERRRLDAARTASATTMINYQGGFIVHTSPAHGADGSSSVDRLLFDALSLFMH